MRTNLRIGEILEERGYVDARQMQEALAYLKMIKKSIEEGLTEDFFYIDLMAAYASLGKITGEKVEDDLVDEIFSKFCMGK